MRITRDDLRHAAKEILEIIKKENIRDKDDLKGRAGKTYQSGKDSIRVIATPNAPGMTPNTFALVYISESGAGMLRAGLNDGERQVRMALCLDGHIAELGYDYYSFDGRGNIAHRKDIAVENGDYIGVMQRELELLINE